MKSQYLFKQYVWMVNTIARHKHITLAELNKLWVDTEMSGGVKMARSSFNRHRDAIEHMYGISIGCDRKNGFRYYIEHGEVPDPYNVQNWMLSTMNMSNLLMEHKSLHTRVLLEDVPSAEYFLSDLMDAMNLSVKVKIFYQKYSAEPGRERLLSPYCVKLYRRRWYVLGQTDNGEMRLFSLDRIRYMSLTDQKFNLPNSFDASAYFADVIGVMTAPEKKKERIVIRAYEREKFYLRDLPLHSSQKEIAETDDYADFEYRLVITSDFIRLLMSRGGLEQVMEPQWLADKLQDMFRYATDMYIGEK